ncbi:flagellar protein FlaG [Massilia sp. LXY-6]|uniref:flagellar protein FlaG n=1 Tax=Massilia sp. LXY-6 TaxID=3379823 RepID=UPI003EE103D8
MLNSLSGSVQAALGNAAATSSNPSARSVTSAPNAGAGKEQGPAREAVEKAVARLNEHTQFTAQGLRFSIDEESGKTVVKIVDSATQEVLRQFPSAEALALSHSIDKMQGLLLREKA